MPDWKLVNEIAVNSPFSDDATEQAVAALVPPGVWTPLFGRPLAERVELALLYLEGRRHIHCVHLQCFQLNGTELPDTASAPLSGPETWCGTGGTHCGWSFFLLEQGPVTPDLDRATVQVYFFHE